MRDSRHRVVITGMGAVSPFGVGVPVLWESLLRGDTAVSVCEMLQAMEGMRTHVAALVPEIDARSIDRKKRRYMSNMSIYATVAAREACAAAGLDESVLASPRTGVCVGSTTGSTQETEEFFESFVLERSLDWMKSTHFFKIMNHSCASNLAQALGVRGRVLAPSAACATGTVAAGTAAEVIALGRQDVMVCGGADELHPLTVAVFDTLEASSTGYNERADETPRPFDRDRDGIVCGEGAGIVVLENMEHAMSRGADILGEVRGFALSNSPESVAHPSVSSMASCLRLALEDAEVAADAVDYVNAHATATLHGDVAEACAIAEAIGDACPVSSLKGHLAHTMAASGVLELIATLRMMRENVVIPTRNLTNIDKKCAAVELPVEPRSAELSCIVKNSFALGGVNSTLVVCKGAYDG